MYTESLMMIKVRLSTNGYSIAIYEVIATMREVIGD